MSPFCLLKLANFGRVCPADSQSKTTEHLEGQLLAQGSDSHTSDVWTACPELNLTDGPACPEIKFTDGPACPKVNLTDGPACPEIKFMDGPAYPEINLTDGPACPEIQFTDVPACPDINLTDGPACPDQFDGWAGMPRLCAWLCWFHLNVS